MQLYKDKISELIRAGRIVLDFRGDTSWNLRVVNFLREAINGDTAFKFESMNHYRNVPWDPDGQMSGIGLLHGNFATWRLCREQQIGYLEGLAYKRDMVKPVMDSHTSSHQSNKVFIVHGHDNAAKESVARFIEKQDLKAIILHEQPNSGKTIIEKFETYSDVGFAIILLTPDDVGGKNPESLQSRARQNVVFELGYFIGKLSRQRVCALYKPRIELPSDFQGVLYTEMDDAGAWKMTLVKELKAAGFSVDAGKIL